MVAVLAESCAHALAASRTPADRAAVLGDEEVQQLMQQLEQRMVAIASDAGVLETTGTRRHSFRQHLVLPAVQGCCTHAAVTHVLYLLICLM